MKIRILTLAAFMGLLTFASCEKEQDPIDSATTNTNFIESDKPASNLKTLVTYSDIPIPASYQSTNYGNTTIASTSYIVDILVTENGDDIEGSFKVTLADSDESIVGFEMSDNILSGTTIAYNFWINHPDPNNQDKQDEHASCIAGCHDEFTDEDGNKIKGRGGCKAKCWGKTAAKFAPLVILLL